MTERLEVERFQVDLGAQRRVSGVDQLEPAVDEVTAHRFGAHAAADSALLLHNEDAAAGLSQNLCRSEAGQACAHHDYVECSHSSQGSGIEFPSTAIGRLSSTCEARRASFASMQETLYRKAEQQKASEEDSPQMVHLRGELRQMVAAG